MLVIALAFLEGIIFGFIGLGLDLPLVVLFTSSTIFGWIFYAGCVKRLHDVGWSGWWILLLPSCIGPFLLFSCGFVKGEAEGNRYGPEPRRRNEDGGGHLHDRE